MLLILHTNKYLNLLRATTKVGGSFKVGGPVHLHALLIPKATAG